MQERNPLSLRSHARRFINESYACGPAAAQCPLQIVHCKTDVVDAGAATFHETSDGRIRPFRFEQLHQRFACLQPGNPRTVGVVQFHLFHSKNVAVEGDDRFEVAHGYSDVRDAGATGGT